MGLLRQKYWNGLPFPFLQIFLTQGSSPHLLHGRLILYCWATKGSTIWCDKMFKFHPFTHSCPVFPATFIDEYLFTLFIFASFDRLIDHKCVLNFWPHYFVPLICVPVFMPIPYCFDDLPLYCSLKSGNVITPALFFFLKLSLAILGLLWFHINFRIICSSTPRYFHRDCCIESVDCFEYYGHFNNINSSNP